MSLENASYKIYEAMLQLIGPGDLTQRLTGALEILMVGRNQFEHALPDEARGVWQALTQCVGDVTIPEGDPRGSVEIAVEAMGEANRDAMATQLLHLYRVVGRHYLLSASAC